MANHGYMTIQGKIQGSISAGCSSEESIGKKCQMGHRDEIMVLSFAHHMSNVGNIRHATHRPVVIVKNVDKSSPLLAQALANREPVDCIIDFYRTSSNGLQEKFYTVEIKDGLICDLMLDIPHSILQSGAEAQEHMSIRYSEIIWTHHLARTRGSAFWSGE
ncbi:Hcp family type VI secretion system effector [Pseudomonas cichorii]|uniref:Hcp family type VI secretion system effector n=1 Tax=Pseudomonas lijiangensis TaxID=2995658 RepID=A0ABX8HN27_9PSED|nr:MULTISPECIES: Hcp family type VI secretion system effector [Pseudomonas syringae group]MBX8490167.1 Hcp family type VI secretion system effector [Pseudomonas cichorii]MBX8499869.1 Hcp family type VI secretion system effector [Pseudomonas lijiangensis]MBX8503628.1 Hcp family type VI secretion system effector [Pseudomonas lijiangensis]MBX8519498.1 Hcp family type VI secretion system effector [Pseudomonas cichorii]MBX8549460.1 Hcp family type VI secretion system effector [Pseudomonas cichorii]